MGGAPEGETWFLPRGTLEPCISARPLPGFDRANFHVIVQTCAGPLACFRLLEYAVQGIPESVAAPLSTPKLSSGSTTWICDPLLAHLFSCHSCTFHTPTRDLQVWRHGHLVPQSSRRGTSQFMHVTMVPWGNEMLRRRAILPASLLELCFIPRSWRRLHLTCF